MKLVGNTVNNQLFESILPTGNDIEDVDDVKAAIAQKCPVQKV